MKFRILYSILGLLALVFFSALTYYAVALGSYNVPSGSMEPTLEVGDRFLIDKLAYDFEKPNALETPQYGDVIVFRAPHLQNTKFVVRITGLPGDTIQMKSGRLYINGIRIERRLVREVSYTNYRGVPVRAKEYEETLPSGVKHRIYEQSDNGRYDHTPTFEVPEGHYFVMGNNRDASNDSRSSGLRKVGFIQGEWILGKAFTTTYSLYDCAQGKPVECDDGEPVGRYFLKIQ